MTMQLPELLDANLRETARIQPSRASVKLNLTPPSTADMTLPPGEPEVRVRDFARLYGPDRSLGVFRVRSVRTAYGDQRQISLESAVCTLEDDLLPAEMTLSGGISAALQRVLGFQSVMRWRLGDVESGVTLPEMDASNKNLLEAVLGVVSTDKDAMIQTDFSTVPWTLHVREKPSAPSCECRMNRNLTGASLTLNDETLCTRVTAAKQEGDAVTQVTRDGDTIATWGVVHRRVSVDEGKDLNAEAQRYLDEHKNPSVSIELDALSLSEMTGEPFDKFYLGQICRVALPHFGVTMDEQIVCMNYSDLLRNPDRVQMTLSSQVNDASSALARLRSSSSDLEQATQSNSRSIAGNASKLHDTYTELVKLGEDTITRFNEVGITLDAHKAQIDLKASQTVVDALGTRVSSAEIAIDGANAQIALKVNRDGVIAAINMSPEEVRIAASRIVLDGYVTTSELSAQIANVNKFFTGEAHATSFSVSGNLSFGSATWGGSTLHKHQIDVVTGGSVSVRTNHESNFYAYASDSATVRRQYSLPTSYTASFSPSKTTLYYVDWE